TIMAAAARPAASSVVHAAADLGQWGDLAAEGGFTCDLTLPGTVIVDSAEPIGAVLERDRMLMSRQPGMQRKHVPLTIDPTTGHLLSGGRYLFDTQSNAESYKAFVDG